MYHTSKRQKTFSTIQGCLSPKLKRFGALFEVHCWIKPNVGNIAGSKLLTIGKRIRHRIVRMENSFGQSHASFARMELIFGQGTNQQLFFSFPNIVLLILVISRLSVGFFVLFHLSRLAFCCFFSTFPCKSCFFGRNEFALCKAVVLK